MHACLDQHTGIKSALHQAHTKVIRLRWHRTYNLMSRMQNISSSHSQSQEETEPCCNETHAAERGQLGVGPVLSEGCCVAASREQQDPCCGAGSHSARPLCQGCSCQQQAVKQVVLVPSVKDLQERRPQAG